MRRAIIFATCTCAAILLAPGFSWGQQTAPWRSAGGSSAGRPDQPVRPQGPTLHRRPAGPDATQSRAPFQLTPQQQSQVDWVLQHWEKQSAKTKTFRCQFTRWEYDPEAPRPKGADPNAPVHTDMGEIRYEAPDKGMFAVEQPETRRERWVCDGESVFEYQFDRKKLVEHPLPDELKGKAIANGPLPFIFQAEAESLKRRYWLRLTTPASVQGEIWIEAYPKHQQDRANFRRAEIILDARRMQPKALQIVLPTGTMKHSYVFDEIKVNDPFGFLQGNPFSATTPIGWRKVVERPEPAQVGERPAQRR